MDGWEKEQGYVLSEGGGCDEGRGRRAAHANGFLDLAGKFLMGCVASLDFSENEKTFGEHVTHSSAVIPPQSTNTEYMECRDNASLKILAKLCTSHQRPYINRAAVARRRIEYQIRRVDDRAIGRDVGVQVFDRCPHLPTCSKKVR